MRHHFDEELGPERVGLELAGVVGIGENGVEIDPVQTGIAKRVQVVGLDLHPVGSRQAGEIQDVFEGIGLERQEPFRGAVDVVFADEQVAPRQGDAFGLDQQVVGEGHHRGVERRTQLFGSGGVGRPAMARKVDLNVAQEHRHREVVVFLVGGEFLSHHGAQGRETLRRLGGLG